MAMIPNTVSGNQVVKPQNTAQGFISQYVSPYINPQKGMIPPETPTQPTAQTGGMTMNTNGVAPGSIGSYKGTPITPGTDTQIQNQIQAINAKGAQSNLNQVPLTSPTAQTDPTPQPTPQQNLGTFPGLVSTLAGTAATSTPQYQAAQQQYLEANKQLADLKQAAANAQFIGAGTNLAEYAGTQGLLSNRLALQEQALTNEMNAAQAAAQTATGQQQAQQSGLAGAAGLGAPQPANVLGFYQPLSGETTPYGGGAAGAFQGGQVQGAFGAGQQYQQVLAPALNAATGILDQANKFISQNPDINPSQFNMANYANAWIRGQQLSDPKYPILSQYINEFLNTLTNLVGSPGMATNYKQQIVNDMVNSTSATGSLQDQMKNLLGIATQKAQSIYGTGQSVSTPGGTQGQPTTFNTTWESYG